MNISFPSFSFHILSPRIFLPVTISTSNTGSKAASSSLISGFQVQGWLTARDLPACPQESSTIYMGREEDMMKIWVCKKPAKMAENQAENTFELKKESWWGWGRSATNHWGRNWPKDRKNRHPRDLHQMLPALLPSIASSFLHTESLPFPTDQLLEISVADSFKISQPVASSYNQRKTKPPSLFSVKDKHGGCAWGICLPWVQPTVTWKGVCKHMGTCTQNKWTELKLKDCPHTQKGLLFLEWKGGVPDR